MALFEWKSPIEAVHGKLWKGMGAAKRKLANAKGELKNFSVSYGKRTTEVKATETAARNRFKTIAQMVATRRTTASQRITDQAAFEAQSAYKTFTSYLWGICTAEYEASLLEP